MPKLSISQRFGSTQHLLNGFPVDRLPNEQIVEDPGEVVLLDEVPAQGLAILDVVLGLATGLF
eukprot:13851181-Alexandrium_andersonii.AAC.1